MVLARVLTSRAIAMTETLRADFQPTRRGALGAGAAWIAMAIAATSDSHAQEARAASGEPAVSAQTAQLADYIAGTLDRPLPADVAHQARLHILDTLAAMVSGSRLKPGVLARRYVETLGGRPQATVVGARFLTSSVNAAFANAMAAQADETDDTNPVGPVHLGAMAVPAALATAEISARTGADFLRAITMGYDIGARIVAALGVDETAKRFGPNSVTASFVAASVSAALLRLDQRQVRHALTYAAQQTSGTGIWKRDAEHVGKSFDYAGAGARNGVMAATMVALGFTAAEDPFSSDPNVFTAIAEKPAPEKLLADLGSKFAVGDTTIKKWTVAAPLQSVLDSTSELLADPAVTPANVSRVTIEMPAYALAIVDNATSPDLCAQHLVALMIADHGVTFASVHDAARMTDPNVLAMRALVTLRGDKALDAARPPRQAIVTVQTKDGRSLSKHTTYVRGLKENPMTTEEVEAKAMDLIGPILGAGRAKTLVATIARLESLGPISRLRPLLQA
jgi:2-methylcitrate dehydratase PrpD